MSNKDHIDDLFKKRFEKEEAPVSGRVWENIKNTLPPEDKQPAGYSWPVVLAVLFFLASIIAFFISNHYGAKKVEADSKNNKELIAENNQRENTEDKIRQINNNTAPADSTQNNFESQNDTEKKFIKEKKTKTSEIPANEKTITQGKNNTTKEKTPLTQKRKVANKGGKEKPIEKKTAEEKVSKNNKDKNDLSKNLVAVNSNKNQSKNKNGKNNSDDLKNDNKENAAKTKNNIENKGTNIDESFTENKKSTSDKESNNIENKKDNSINPATNNGVDANTINAENKNANTEEVVVNNKSLNDTTAKDSRDIKNDDVVNGTNKTAINSDSATSSNSVLAKENKEVNADTLKQKEEEKVKDSTTVAEEENKKKKENKPSPFSFDVFLAPSYNYRSLKGSNAESINQYEQSKISLGGGARINYSLSDQFSLSSGLVYANFGEKFVYQKDSIVSYTTTYTAGYYFQDSLSGDSIFVPTDSVISPNTITEKYKNSNRYQYLSIPLFVTYNFGKGKLIFSLSLGVAANILVKASSTRFNGSGTIVQESSSGSNNPFRPVSFSFMLSPGIAYDFKERWKLLIQPQLNYFISSIYKDGNPFTQRPYSLELKAGIRYYLK